MNQLTATTPLLSEATLYRVVFSLLRAELAKLRPESGALDPSTWKPETSFGEGGLALDSYELIELAGAVNRMFHMSENGGEEYLLRYKSFGEWGNIVWQSWKYRQESVTFSTSGTSGTPKRCTQPLRVIWQEACEHARLLEGRKRIVSTVPAHHIFGFQFTALTPEALGVPVVDARDYAPSRLARELEAGDLIVAVPFYWEYLERSISSFRSGVRGVSATGPLSQDLYDRLTAAGIECVYESYGSSETAGIGWRRSPEEPYRLYSFWARAAEPDRDHMERTLPGGEKLPPVLPMDRFEWESDELFRLAGRRDNAVQVGGTNVFPEAVAEKIRSREDVADCAVRLQRPDEGKRLKAFIVPQDPAVLTAGSPQEIEFRKDLEIWCEKHLETEQRPKTFTFGAETPRNELGKPRDW